MELRQLKYFIQLAEIGHFGRAAEACGITQPALSKSIRTLEIEVGADLVERTMSGVFVTAAGRKFLERAYSATEEIQLGLNELTDDDGSGPSHIRLGCSPISLRPLFRGALLELSRAFPKTRFTVTSGLRGELLHQLTLKRIDAALCLSNSATDSQDFEFDEIAQEQIICVCDHQHPLVTNPDVDLKDLAQCEWILPLEDEDERRALFGAFETLGLPAPTVRFNVPSSLMMRDLLENSDFVSYLPKSSLEGDPYFKNLREVPIAPKLGAPRLGLVTRQQPFSKPLFLKKLRSFLRRQAKPGRPPRKFG